MTSNAQRTSTQECKGPYKECSSGGYYLVVFTVFTGTLGRSGVKLVSSCGAFSSTRVGGGCPVDVDGTRGIHGAPRVRIVGPYLIKFLCMLPCMTKPLSHCFLQRPICTW